MKISTVMAKVEELQARDVDKAFDSKEKAQIYNRTRKEGAFLTLTLLKLTTL